MSSLSTPYFSFQPKKSLAPTTLYVDFDGVLHHEAVMWHRRRGIYMCRAEAPGRVLFEWVSIFEDILSDFPDVDLVLSSTWCITPGFGKALKRLPPGLRARFVGGTFHRRIHGADPWTLHAFRSTTRYQQIKNDVQRRRPRKWLAIDDDVSDWPEAELSNLVACAGDLGISAAGVQLDLRKKLSLLGQ